MKVGKNIRDGICHRYMKVNNKYMKDYDENRESLHVKYLNINNLYRQAVSQKLHVSDFKWLENTPQFNKDFIKKYNKDTDIT